MKTRKQRKSIDEVRTSRINELKVKELKKITDGATDTKGAFAVSGRTAS